MAKREKLTVPNRSAIDSLKPPVAAEKPKAAARQEVEDDNGLDGDGKADAPRQEREVSRGNNRVDDLLAGLNSLLEDDLEQNDKKPLTQDERNNFMWAFVRAWTGYGNDPVVFLNFMWMLNPAHVKLFSRIHPNVKRLLVARAAELLSNADEDTDPALLDHWRSIINGKMPFGWKVLEIPKETSQ